MSSEDMYRVQPHLDAAWADFVRDCGRYVRAADPGFSCAETVYMALQGSGHGGIWTT